MDFDLNLEQHQQETRHRAKKHLIFSLSDKRYALPLSKVKEVIRMSTITPLPKVPAFYKGLINIRGQIISVIDLRLKLGFEKTTINPKMTGIIISHVGDILVGSIVDEVIEVVGYQDSDINISETSRIDSTGDGVYGVAKSSIEDSELTLLIDIEKAMKGTNFKVIDQQAKSQAQGELSHAV